MVIKKLEKKVNIEKDSLNGIEYPVFCFKHLQLSSIKKCKDPLFYFYFLERLKKLSELGWNGIGSSDRHSFGTENLPINKIKPKLPSFVTPDVDYLLVFRANGDNRPFLGIKRGKLFHILFIEFKFGDIYNH